MTEISDDEWTRPNINPLEAAAAAAADRYYEPAITERPEQPEREVASSAGAGLVGILVHEGLDTDDQGAEAEEAADLAGDFVRPTAPSAEETPEAEATVAEVREHEQSPEQAPEPPKRYRLDLLTRPTVPTAETVEERSQPLRSRIRDIVNENDGAPLTTEITFIPGKGNDVILSDPRLAPRGGRVHEMTPDERTKADESDVEFTHYARVVRTVEPQPAPNGPEPRQAREPMNLGDIERSKNPIRILSVAVPVDPEVTQQLASDVSDEIAGASVIQSRQGYAEKLRETESQLTEAGDDPVVVETFLVGGRNELEAIENGRFVARDIMQHSRSTRWQVPADAQGRAVYEGVGPALDAALADVVPDRNFEAIVSPDFHGEVVRYPGVREDEAALSGLPVSEQYIFPTNQKFAPGDKLIRVGDTLNADGEVVGDFDMAEQAFKRHIGAFGSTGAGKSVLLRNVIAAVKQAMPDTAVITHDALRDGEYGAKLAGALAQRGVTGEAARIHTLSLRSGVLASLNPLQLHGREPDEALVEGRQTVISTIPDKDTARIVGKWTDPALSLIYIRTGVNPETGEPLFEHGRILHAHLGMGEQAVEEIINSSDFQSKTAGDMLGALRSQIAQPMRGIAKRLFAARIGFPIDAEKLVTIKGTVIVESGLLASDINPQITGARTLQDTIRAGLRQVRNKRGIEGSTDELLALAIFEEAGDLFNKNAHHGEMIARDSRVVRGEGLGIVVADQVPDNLHPTLLNNTNTYFAGRQPKPADVLHGRLGPIPQRNLEVVTTLPAGEFLHYSPNTPDGAIRVRVPNHEASPDYKPEGPEAFLDKGYFENFYDGDIMRRAREKLLKEPWGNQLYGFAQINTFLLTQNAPLIDITNAANPNDYKAPDGRYLSDQLRAMTDPKDVATVHCAIEMAVEEAVTSRIGLQSLSTKEMDAMEAYATKIRNDMKAQLTNDGRPRDNEPRNDLALPTHYYDQARNFYVNKMTAPRVKQTEVNKELISKIPGRTAAEQEPIIAEKIDAAEAQLSEEIHRAATSYVTRAFAPLPFDKPAPAPGPVEGNPAAAADTTVTDPTTPQAAPPGPQPNTPETGPTAASPAAMPASGQPAQALDPQALQNVNHAIQRIYNGLPPARHEQALERMRPYLENIAGASIEVVERAAGPLGITPEVPVVPSDFADQVIQYAKTNQLMVPSSDPEKPPIAVAGLLAFGERINNRIAAYREIAAPPVPQKIKDMYPDIDFSPEGKTAEEMVNTIDKAQAAYNLKKPLHRLVNETDMLLAPDNLHANGGMGLDNVVVQHIEADAKHKGEAYRKLDAQMHGGRSPKKDLVTTIGTDNEPHLKDYRDALSLHYIYGSNATLSGESIRAIIGAFDRDVNGLHAARALYLRQQQLARQRAAAQNSGTTPETQSPITAEEK